MCYELMKLFGHAQNCHFSKWRYEKVTALRLTWQTMHVLWSLRYTVWHCYKCTTFL